MAKLLSGTTVYGNATVNANLTVGGTTTVNQLYNGGTGVFQANGNTSIAGTTTSQTIYLQGGNNLFANSANLLSSPAWTTYAGYGGTTVGGQTDPFGGSNAFLWTPKGQYDYIYSNQNIIQGQTYTISFWAYTATGTRTLYIEDFNSNIFGSITVGNIWTRYSVTFTSLATTKMSLLNDRGSSGWLPIYLYGPQLELGSIASPYTQTTTNSPITQTNNLYIPNGNIIGSPTVTGNLSVTGNLIITGTTISNTTINTTDAIITTNTVVTPSITIGSSGSAITVTDVYDLDDISYATDGFTNVFPLTYNQNQQTFPSPFNLMVTINGLIQPAFYSKYDTVWLSNILPASKGYTLDISGNPTTNNYIKFADCPPPNSQVDIRTVVGSTPTTPKTYPFKPLDIFMGY